MITYMVQKDSPVKGQEFRLPILGKDFPLELELWDPKTRTRYPAKLVRVDLSGEHIGVYRFSDHCEVEENA